MAPLAPMDPNPGVVPALLSMLLSTLGLPWYRCLTRSLRQPVAALLPLLGQNSSFLIHLPRAAADS